MLKKTMEQKELSANATPTRRHAEAEQADGLEGENHRYASGGWGGESVIDAEAKARDEQPIREWDSTMAVTKRLESIG